MELNPFTIFTKESIAKQKIHEWLKDVATAWYSSMYLYASLVDYADILFAQIYL